MSAQNVFPVTIEQLTKWKGLASSDPARVVRILMQQEGQKASAEGDSIEDIAPALLAVQTECAMQSDAWDALVNAGVVNGICQNLVAHRVRTTVFPDDPMEPVVIAEKIQSPNYQALKILSKAATHISSKKPLKSTLATYKRFVADLKVRWAEITGCIWADIKGRDVPEGVFCALIVGNLLRTSPDDASFYVSICDPANMTIPVLARLWATSATKVVTNILLGIFKNPRAVIAQSAGPSHYPTKEFLMKRFYHGVAPSTTSCQVAARIALDIFTRRLSESSEDLSYIADEVDLISFLGDDGAGGGSKKDVITEPEFARALRQSEDLWRAMFALIQKVVADSFPPDTEKDLETWKETMKARRENKGKKVPEKERDWDKAVEGHLLRDFVWLWRALVWSPEHDRQEVELTVDTMTKAGVFDMLDDAVYAIIQVPCVTQALTLIFQAVAEIVSNSRNLSHSLDAQFPRANTLFALFRKDWYLQANGAPQVSPMAFANNKVPSPTDRVWDHAVWQTFSSLQSKCRDWRKVCGRRECPRRAEVISRTAMVKCSFCQEIVFCSEECGDLEKEHDQGCQRGFVTMVNRSI